MIVCRVISISPGVRKDDFTFFWNFKIYILHVLIPTSKDPQPATPSLPLVLGFGRWALFPGSGSGFLRSTEAPCRRTDSQRSARGQNLDIRRLRVGRPPLIRCLRVGTPTPDTPFTSGDAHPLIHRLRVRAGSFRAGLLPFGWDGRWLRGRRDGTHPLVA